MDMTELSHLFSKSIANSVQAGMQGLLSDVYDQPTIDQMHAVLATKLQPGVLSVFQHVENLAFARAAVEIAKSGTEVSQEFSTRVLALKHNVQGV